MMDGDKLKKILLDQNYLTESDLKQAEKTAAAYGLNLADALVEESLLTEELLGQAVAEYYGVLWLDLKKEKVDTELMFNIPEPVARAYKILPVVEKAGRIRLGMVDPKDLVAAHLAEKRLGKRIEICYLDDHQFEGAMEYYAGSLTEEFAKISKIWQQSKLNPQTKGETVTKIVDLLIEKGYRSKASDIHIEPYIKKIMIRFRVDGVMHRMLEIDKELAEAIVSRLKVMARLRTDEHRSAQDGKIRFPIDGKNLDIRVSIVPITEGENVVLRLLSGAGASLSLSALGLGKNDLDLVKQAITRPHGMILVTGPTGSGKTTTLYAALNILNQEEVHIATIEDPVEYAIEGVSQIQVDARTNLTFAVGLRSILRQDPDIIMVGEIRDSETAGIAINSALTGHLVLSTLHTNDAPTALPRLLDMGVEPFLVASTVNLVIAQRLVRRNCEKCRVSAPLTPEELLLVENEPGLKAYLASKGYKNPAAINVYRGVGCPVCDHTGYQGRLGIFEILVIDDLIRQMIVDKNDAGRIMAEAKKRGMKTMLEDGIDKALSGLTSIDEILRVTRA